MVLLPLRYFSYSEAQTSHMLSLQGVLLCQAVLCQPDTESLLTAAALVAITVDAEVLRLTVCKLYPARYGSSA